MNATLKAIRELRAKAEAALCAESDGYIPLTIYSFYGFFPDEYRTLHTRPIDMDRELKEFYDGEDQGSCLRYLKSNEGRLFYFNENDRLTKFELTQEFVKRYIETRRELRRWFTAQTQRIKP